MSEASYFTGPFAPMCFAYVTQKRISGLDYSQQAMLLRMFDNFCKDYDIENYTITKEIALTWCKKRPNEADATRYNRVGEMQRFSQYLCKQVVFEQPNLGTREGRRDFAFLSLIYESAARASEIAGICVGDIRFEKKGAIVHLKGKGKKFRDIPLLPEPAKILKNYLSEESRHRRCDIAAPLFCNRSKEPLTRGGVYYIVQKYVALAQQKVPDLFPVQVHPHVFRHSRAMHWLEAGVDLQYIKDLLGHSDIKNLYSQAFEQSMEMGNNNHRLSRRD